MFEILTETTQEIVVLGDFVFLACICDVISHFL